MIIFDSMFEQRQPIPQDNTSYQKVRRFTHAVGMNEFKRRVEGGLPRALGITTWANLVVEKANFHREDWLELPKQNTVERRINELANKAYWKVAPWQCAGKVKDMDPIAKTYAYISGYLPNPLFVEDTTLRAVLQPQTKLFA